MARKIISVVTIQTLRKTLLEIPLVMVKLQRKRHFRFEKTFWGKWLYEQVMFKLQSMRPLQL